MCTHVSMYECVLRECREQQMRVQRKLVHAGRGLNRTQVQSARPKRMHMYVLTLRSSCASHCGTWTGWAAAVSGAS